MWDKYKFFFQIIRTSVIDIFKCNIYILLGKRRNSIDGYLEKNQIEAQNMCDFIRIMFSIKPIQVEWKGQTAILRRFATKKRKIMNNGNLGLLFVLAKT